MAINWENGMKIDIDTGLRSNMSYHKSGGGGHWLYTDNQVKDVNASQQTFSIVIMIAKRNK